MPDPKFRRRVKIIVPVLSVAVVAAFGLAAWSFYSSFRQACDSRNRTLAVLNDVIVVATTPARGDNPTVGQLRRMREFRAAAVARINEARC